MITPMALGAAGALLCSGGFLGAEGLLLLPYPAVFAGDRLFKPGGPVWKAGQPEPTAADQRVAEDRVAGASADCRRLKEEVGRAQLIVFLDPSERSRAVATRHLIERVVRPLQLQDLLERVGYRCAGDALGDEGVWGIADEQILPELAVLADVYKRALKGATSAQLSGRDPALWRAVMFAESARPAEAAAREQQRARAVEYSLPTASDLVHVSACPEWADEAARTAARIASRPSRLEQIDAGLAIDPAVLTSRRCTGEGALLTWGLHEASLSYRQWPYWAIRQVTGNPDPRRWDPIEVAHLGALARQHHSATLNGDVAAMTLSAQILNSLRPMGLRRALALIGYPADTTLDPEAIRVLYYVGPEHFEMEGLVYRAEWHGAHPEPPADAPEEERRVWSNGQSAYSRQRYLETDRDAPHPNMEAIEAELKRLEEAKHQP